jgi:NADH-quinone oxidoreductase subunit N
MLLFLPELGALAVAAALFLVMVGIGAEVGDEPADRLAARRRRAARMAYRVSLAGALGVVVCAVVGLSQSGPLFFGSYDVGPFTQFTKLALAVGLLCSVWLAREARNLPHRDYPEFLFFLVLSVLGMMMLVSANELVSFYVALELSAYCLYIVVPLAMGFQRHNEASFKYFLFGAAISAVALMGMAIVYGLTGTTVLPEIAAACASDPQPLLVAGVTLALVGILFKLAVVPFHFWAPDVYESSADSVTAFVASASKLGAIAALLRLLSMGISLEALWWVLAGIAVLSMTWGNLAALVQKDLKRLLAYSSVAQGGYIALGLIGRDGEGYSAALFYAAGYFLMLFAVFIVVVEMGRMQTDGDNRLSISSLDGLHRRAPFLAALLLVGVLGLAGVPPTVGFTGKWLLFKAAMVNGGFWLILVAGINNTISVYYYLVVIKAAYVHEPGEDLGAAVLPWSVKLAGGATMTAVVLLGVFPQWLIPYLRDAMDVFSL